MRFRLGSPKTSDGWETIFAFLPKKIGDDEYVWLEKVERLFFYQCGCLTVKYRPVSPTNERSE